MPENPYQAPNKVDEAKRPIAPWMALLTAALLLFAGVMGMRLYRAQDAEIVLIQPVIEYEGDRADAPIDWREVEVAPAEPSK